MTVAIVNAPLIFGAVAAAIRGVKSQAPASAEAGIPDDLRAFLARLRLLGGVPFSHLVPDAELLPAESIRFFHLDREWTDALVEGALSVGTVTTLDREQLQTVYARVRDAVDTEERRLRMPGADPGFGAAGAVTGFLLRSAAVSGWPGIHVRAYDAEVSDKVDASLTAHAMRILRLERLAPAVLLCLFDGLPRVVHVEEPRQGIQFGVDLNGAGATLNTRNLATGENTGSAVNVPFRQGSKGVVHIRELEKRVRPGLVELDSAQLALQLLQFPYRQVFGNSAGITFGIDDAFRPTVLSNTLTAPPVE